MRGIFKSPLIPLFQRGRQNVPPILYSYVKILKLKVAVFGYIRDKAAFVEYVYHHLGYFAKGKFCVLGQVGDNTFGQIYFYFITGANFIGVANQYRQPLIYGISEKYTRH